MPKTLVITDNVLFLETVKRFTKKTISEFVFQNEKILDSYNEFIGICAINNIENIILFEETLFEETNFLLQQKRYINLYEALDVFKIKKFISFIEFNKTNYQNNKIFNEEQIFDQSNQIYNINKKFLLKNNELINNLKQTKCITIIHGELYGRELNNSIVSLYIQKFIDAKKDSNQIEINENPDGEYQLTFIDNLIDITLFLLLETEKLQNLEKLYWNIASPEIIKLKDIIHSIALYYKNTKLLFSNTDEINDTRFLATEKFISEFVQYPYIKFEEAIKIILTN